MRYGRRISSRQRVAFALSEILVVSQTGALEQMPYAIASYNDVLVWLAFDDFRHMLRLVTTHPAMGVYFEHAGQPEA